MKKILIIDDNPEILENIAEILELANYKVCTAENGKTGFGMAVRELPDLIVCDVVMPVLDGYGMLHLLKTNSTIRNTPFIFLTAKTDRAEMRKGMELGADDYITKPFEETELLNAIQCRLKKADMVKEDTCGESALGCIPEDNEKEIFHFLAENRDVNIYKKKQLIYSEGNRPSRLFYILKGKVKTFRTNDDGKQLITGLYNEGDFLRYVPLMEGTVYKDMAEAIEQAELVTIPKDDFEQLMSTSRLTVKKFTALLAQNISHKEQQLVGMAYNSLRKKVAETLIGINSMYKASINLSRQNLAALAGTATESMIRTLNEFKNESLIDINDGSITIVNEKKLENMVN